MKTLEFATDLMVQTGQCEIATHSDRITQTTPAEPNFWFGNRVLFPDAPRDADSLISRFHGDFPDANHICLGWDIPDLSLELVESVFADTDLTVEQSDTLALKAELKRTPVPQGVTIRPFNAQSDWRQSEAIGKADLLRENMPGQGMDQFLRSRSQGRQTQIEKGIGQWFGAFVGDTLAGDMGIFHDDRVIRYQSVQTHEKFRRRGVCSALLCASLDWAKSRAADAVPVIVAHANSDAGRLYRRAGFSRAETTISAYRPPKSGDDQISG